MYNYNYYMNNMFRNNNLNNMSIYQPSVGYDNGNLFTDLYSQYKNYKPTTLVGKNEKENLLLEISRYCFAMHELNLYLDLNPSDQSIITLFNDYKNKTMKLINDYEMKYGPMTVFGNTSDNNFEWEKNTFPWEDRFYV